MRMSRQCAANFNIYNKKTFFEVFVFIKMFNLLKKKATCALKKARIPLSQKPRRHLRIQLFRASGSLPGECILKMFHPSVRALRYQ